MPKNVVRDCGAPVYATTKNIASAKLSGDLISFPLTAGAGVPVALLTQDAGTSADGVSCIIGGVIVRYTCVTADTADPGAKLYFDVGNNRLTTTAGSNNLAGRCAKTKGGSDTTADVILNMP